MSRRSSFAAGALAAVALVAVSAAALFVRSRHAGRGPPADAGPAGMAPGDERRFALRLEMELERPGRPDPIVVVLTGELAAAVSEVRAAEYDVALEVVKPDITGSGVPAAGPAELEGLRRRLARVFWATYRKDGTALRVHFPRDIDPADRNLLQILVTDAQLVRPAVPQPHWTALERDAAGLFLASYEQTAPASVLKRKLKYVELDGADGTAAQGGMKVDLTASERRFSLDAAGAVTGVDGSDSSRIPLPMTEGQSMGVRIALRLDNLRAGRAPDRAGSLERARGTVDTSPIRTHRPSAEATQTARDERVLDGHPAAAVLEAAQKGDDDPLLPRRLEALFRRQPAAIAPAVALVRQRGGLRPVTDALGAAGTPPAVDALLALARDPSLAVRERVDALSALYHLKQPEPSVLSRTGDLLDDGDQTVRRAAQLALGALARAARTAQPAAAASADEQLARRYAPGAPVDQRVALLGALGNSVGAASVRVLREALHDPESLVRASAARDLRSADDGDIDALLAKALREDPDPRVRTAAIFAASYRSADPFVDVLALAATTDRADEVRTSAVGLLRKYQELYPSAGAALKKVAEADAKPGLRRLAREALAEAQPRKGPPAGAVSPAHPGP